MKPMKNMAAPTTVFHSFVLLFISAKLSLNLRRYTEERKDRAAGRRPPRGRAPQHGGWGGSAQSEEHHRLQAPTPLSHSAGGGVQWSMECLTLGGGRGGRVVWWSTE